MLFSGVEIFDSTQILFNVELLLKALTFQIHQESELSKNCSGSTTTLPQMADNSEDNQNLISTLDHMGTPLKSWSNVGLEPIFS